LFAAGAAAALRGTAGIDAPLSLKVESSAAIGFNFSALILTLLKEAF
jgi:hypothetical protein